MGSAEDTLERGVKENDDFSSGSSQTTPQLPNVPLAPLSDPDFVSEAKKSKFAIDPTSGQELAKIISDLEKLSPAVLTKLKKVLSPKKQ